jgi:hypothetical protein
MSEVPPESDRVDGWKSIEDYLDRDVTAVIRWAKLHAWNLRYAVECRDFVTEVQLV